MKAIRYHEKGGPEVLRLEEVPMPEPGSHEVLIKVEAAGVNYADTMRRWGDYYPIPTPLPHIPGGELVGTVTATGAGVDTRKIGQRVFAWPVSGAYAQFVASPVERTAPCPAGLAPTAAVAILIQGLTAALLLREAAHLQRGETVFVEAAAGGVGLLAVQLAKLYGAGKVIAGASTGEKRELAQSVGADAAVDYTTPGWSKQVLALNGGRGVDVILEMTGGKVFEEALHCLGPLGRTVVYGVASREPYSVPTPPLIGAGHGVIGFALPLYLQRPGLVGDTLRELAEWVRSDKLKVKIGAAFPLVEAADAHRMLEGRKSVGKLVMLPWE